MTAHPLEAQSVALTPDPVRKQRLALAIQQEVVAGGRVESQSDFTAVIRYGKDTNHMLHLVLTLVTFGLWLFVWPVVWAVQNAGKKTVTLTVDEYGNVLRQEV